MQKTYNENISQINNLIYQNSNQAILGSIMNTVLIDLVDSVTFKSVSEITNTTQVTETYTSPSVSGDYTGIYINYKSKGVPSVYINGIKDIIGNQNTFPFYFVDSNDIIKDTTNIQSGDRLFYNSSQLGFVLDSTYTIQITYITE